MLASYASRLNLFNADDNVWSTDINKESLEASNAYSTYSDFFWPSIMAWKAYGLSVNTDSEAN